MSQRLPERPVRTINVYRRSRRRWIIGVTGLKVLCPIT